MKIGDNTVAGIRKYYHTKLDQEYDSREVDAMFYLSMEHLFGLERKDLMIMDKRFSESELLQIFAVAKRLQTGEPIQYIFGSTEFCELKIQLNSHVLIPRQETEELVYWVHEKIQGKGDSIQILDICTGSGCIALALKSLQPKNLVSACDVSEEALEIAQENATNLDLNVNWFKYDVLSINNQLPQVYDAIVSNPPYVTNSEAKLMRKNVLEHEPHLALFVDDDDPLLFHRTILELGKRHLKKDGMMFFEINERFGQELRALMIEFGYANVEVKKDLSNRNRFVTGSLEAN